MRRARKEESFLRNPAAYPTVSFHASSVPRPLEWLHHLARAAGERILGERDRPRSAGRCDRPSQKARRQPNLRDAAFASLSLTECGRLNTPHHESSPGHARVSACGANQGQIKADSYMSKTDVYVLIN